MKKKSIFLLMAIFGLVIIIGGVSFAWFTYYKEGNTSNAIFGGDIHLDLTESGDTLTLSNIFPETEEQARNRTNNTLTFTVSGQDNSEDGVIYNILLNHGSTKSGKERFSDNHLVFDLMEIDNNEEYYLVNAKSFNELNDTNIFSQVVIKSAGKTYLNTGHNLFNGYTNVKKLNLVLRIQVG